MTMAEMQTKSMLDFAIEYAKNGIPVFPLSGKMPRTAHGFKDATTDQNIINQWWSRNPDSNIGIPTGLASGLFVLDVDGQEGETSLRQFEAQYGALPPTQVILTGKGRHLYFKYPDSIKLGNSAGKFGTGLDTRGDGGYVVAPPSKHPETGTPYIQHNDTPMADIPQWLLDLLAKPVQTVPEYQPITVTPAHERYAEKALQKAVSTIRSATKGTRNHVLNAEAYSVGQLVAAGALGRFAVEGTLLDAALSIGLGKQEAENTIGSGLNAGANHPRDLSDIGNKGEKVSGKTSDLKTMPSSLSTVTLTELMQKEFPPIKWIVPELLPEGLTLLVGAPKLGKSWMALSICRSVAFGGYSINNKRAELGSVLYLALEDGERRLQSRYEMICKNNEWAADNLHFTTQYERYSGIRPLELWLDKHPDCRLVVIDTWQKWRGPSPGGHESYANDYASLEPLQAMAIQRGISVILIHHSRKAEASDPFDKVSGTTAMTGAADCTWLLTRSRGEAEAKLHITGRDVEEHELALSFDATNCLWSVLGNAKDIAASKEEKEVLDFARACDSDFSPKELAEGLEITHESAKKRLQRLSHTGKLDKPRPGRYQLKRDTGTEGDNWGVPAVNKAITEFQLKRDRGTLDTFPGNKLKGTEVIFNCPPVPVPLKGLTGQDSGGDRVIVPVCPPVPFENDPLVEGVI